MLVEIFAEAFVDERFDQTLDVAVELAFGLALELWLRELYGNDGDEAFADVVAIDGDFVLLLFEHAGGIRVVIERARERGAEAGKVRAAVHGVDGVGEGKNVLGVAVVVLQRDFDIHLLALAFHVNRRVVQRLLAAVQVLDEFGDAAGEAELGFFVAAFVFERDLQAFVEKGQLAEALRKRIEAVNGGAENFRVGVERDFRSGLARLAGSFELRGGHALFVGLFPDLSIAPDFEIEPVGESVDDGNADAVQAARNFVSVAIEFSAGVQHGHHDFRGGLFLRGMHVHGNAAAVVDHGDADIVVHGDVDFIAEAGHGFVHGIIHHFPDQVMQSELAGGTDVHRRTLADRFDAAQHFDGCGVVLVPAFCGRSFLFSHGSCVSSENVRMAFDNLREGGRADALNTCRPV